MDQARQLGKVIGNINEPQCRIDSPALVHCRLKTKMSSVKSMPDMDAFGRNLKCEVSGSQVEGSDRERIGWRASL